MTAPPMRIEVRGISKRFGGLHALDDVSFSIAGGQVLAVIGPNGAGKSTLINCLSGAVEASRGTVLLDGRPLPRGYSGRLVELGLTRTFQQVRLFASLTALEHLLLARRSFGRTARFRAAHTAHGDVRGTCLALLDQVGLLHKRDMRPDELAYGERRRLEIARGLAIEPGVFLVDELAAGSTGAEQGLLASLIKGIAATGAAVLLVEHHMDLIGRVADQVLVLNFGQAIASGPFDSVKRDPRVVAAYLGSEAA